MLSLFVLLYVLIIAIFKTIVFLYVQYLYFLIICWIKSNQIIHNKNEMSYVK